jgi:hypothetical protein
MYQPWIFATTLAVGGGLVAYAVGVQSQTSAPLPDIRPEPTAVHVIAPPAPVRVSEPPAPSPALQIEPVTIYGVRHHARPQATAQPAQEEAAPAPERPCSDWRELGPTHVVSGEPSGALAVRELCQ